MRKALTAAFLAAAVLGLASCGSNGGGGPEGPLVQRFKPAVSPDFFGTNANELRELASDRNPALRAVLEKQLAAIQGAGLSWVRALVDWSKVEPLLPIRHRHQYKFAEYDPWVAALARHKLTWQPIFMHPPDWATNIKDRLQCGAYYRSTPPARTEDMASFAATVAGRYGAHGSFWAHHRNIPYRPVRNFEVWNEPNYTAFWCPTIDPAAYAGLYLAARQAVHAVDPSGKVVVGGLAFQPGPGAATQLGDGKPVSFGVAQFLKGMLAAQPALHGKIDVVGVHAYADDPQQLFKAIAFDRQALAQAGLGTVPMLFNESGWYTNGPTTFIKPISDGDRADNYRDLASGISRTNCNLIGFAAQTWRTAEKNSGDPEEWYGLANLDGSLNKSGQAYRDAVLLVRGFGSDAPPRAVLHFCP